MIIPPLVPIKKIATIITGFIGSAEHVKIIANFVRIIKTLKPKIRYFCDPVMGDIDKGQYMGSDVPKQANSIESDKL